MKAPNDRLPLIIEEPVNQRREFLKKGVIIGALTGLTGIGLITSCKGDAEQEVTPTEDLMREHGLLNRILLIYDSCRMRLMNNEKFPLDSLNNSALIIRNFVENYHEKLEEDYLFPRFEKANKLTDLVGVLRTQHQAGRKLTDRIVQIAGANSVNDDDKQKLIDLLKSFNTMYRPHEAREDTILFPASKEIISKKEYDTLGDKFEDKENELFGKNGFETMVGKVADIEKQLGIYDLAQFTPVNQ
jgi:hemerythrin-like domain-containing protein